jgi:O-acetyl-ADP-ribose deacetylase (regulator of RNase III)
VKNINCLNLNNDWAILLDFLLRESGQPGHVIPLDECERWRLLRSLMNVRPPQAVPPEMLDRQDRLLRYLKSQKSLVAASALPVMFDVMHIAEADKIALWRGDITCLEADAIVNAANSALLGCFLPLHGCIDNAIHSAAGMQLRQDCHAIMQNQRHPEPPGQAKITPGYNLPCRYVIHTVGPTVIGAVTVSEIEQLADCYRACLEAAQKQGDIRTLAFCCISTGEFHFPAELAARIASWTIISWLGEHHGVLDKVIFNVFSQEDYDLYFKLWKTL